MGVGRGLFGQAFGFFSGFFAFRRCGRRRAVGMFSFSSLDENFFTRVDRWARCRTWNRWIWIDWVAQVAHIVLFSDVFDHFFHFGFNTGFHCFEAHEKLSRKKLTEKTERITKIATKVKVVLMIKTDGSGIFMCLCVFVSAHWRRMKLPKLNISRPTPKPSWR